MRVSRPKLTDSISAPQPLGFPFPFEGMTYTDIAISDHGLCFLSNGSFPAAPVAVPLVYTPQAIDLVVNGPVIAPFWTDTNPSATGDVYVNAGPTECVITWQDMGA
jgi:hypothetical protein